MYVFSSFVACLPTCLPLRLPNEGHRLVRMSFLLPRPGVATFSDFVPWAPSNHRHSSAHERERDTERHRATEQHSDSSHVLRRRPLDSQQSQAFKCTSVRERERGRETEFKSNIVTVSVVSPFLAAYLLVSHSGFLASAARF